MASITFPSSPSNGDTYTYDGLVYEYNSAKNKWSVKSTNVLGGLSADAVGESLVPTANVTYDLGTADKAFRDLYLSGSSINLGGATITATGSTVTLPAGSSVGGTEIGTGGGTTVYATLDQLPRSGVDTGATAFVTATSRFYIYNGTGWFNVAVVNQAPTITSAPSSVYNLYADGTPTILTLAATDADGDELTWSYSAPDASGKATITQSNNVFTITPLTNISDTSFNIDFEVTDGINIATDSSTINIDNRSPTIDTGPSATYVLATDGSDTVITLAATDPDGQSITWTYTDSGLTDQATISQSGNEFTITPNSTPGAYTDFTLTFTASDSIESTSTSPTTFSLTFLLVVDEWSDTVLSIGTSSTNGLGNSTFVDRSTNAHTVTPTGTPAQTAFHPYLDNWSVEFDGSGDYLDLGSNNDAVSFGTGDFTIECWINPKTISSEDGLITGSGVGWVLYFYPNSNLQWGRTTPQTPANLGSTSSSINTNEWTHVEVTRSSGTVRIFLNGIINATITDTANYSATGNLRIGLSHSNIDFDGSISNVRVIKGTALHTSNFTPPTEKLTAVSGTSLLTCQSNRFIDNSTNGHTITINGNPEISSFNPFGQESEYAIGENKGSFYLDGTNTDQVYANDGLSAGNGAYTIEFWWYPTDLGRAHLLYDRSFRNNVLSLQTDYTGATSTVFYRDGGESSTTVNQSLTNQWNHIVVTRSASYHYLYVNGVRYSFASVGGAVDTSSDLYVGCASSAGSGYEYNQGWISDFRVTASSLYSSTTITPPTAPVGNTNASLYLPMDNAGIFDKTGNHDLTLVSVTTSTTQTKYDDTSYYIASASGNYIGLDSLPDFARAPFTLEMWVHPTATNTNMVIFDTRPSASLGFSWNLNSGTGMSVYAEGSTRMTETNVISTNTWNHIALVFDGTNATAYSNGTAVASPFSIGSSSPWSASQKTLGAVQYTPRATASGFVGYIEGFQLLIGVTKYTANFTPPTSTQGRSYQAVS